MDPPPLLVLDGISKRYGAVRALDAVYLSVYAGEVVALLGDNGAGKSTLVKIIAGNVEADAGALRYAGRVLTGHSPAQARALGIETVYQDLSLCPNLDVVANFFMGRERVRRRLGVPLLDEAAMEAETGAALARIGTVLPSVRVPVEQLSGGQRQAIELARFVHWGGRLVVLDEPFAALGVEQTRRGLDLIERVRAQGIAVVVITHNVLHALQVADRLVVLRQGRVVAERAAPQTDATEVIALITGTGQPA
ncbi:MAG: ATP-binding cassette domain-containing protein [Rhodothermales bacterium]|nr:ATP-binding cassette domain-containing protein [Rhodothermales bacterium]